MDTNKVLDGIDFTGIDGKTTETPVMYRKADNTIYEQWSAESIGLEFNPTHTCRQTWKVEKNSFGYYGARPYNTQYINIKTGVAEFAKDGLQ